MDKSNEQRMCEEATGCVQAGRLVYYGEGGTEFSEYDAAKAFQNYELIEVPEAGAGSYREIFTAFGFDDVEVNDWTSSAGDWSFGVRIGDKWYMASQENRHPRHGFKYLLSDMVLPCECVEELFERAGEI